MSSSPSSAAADAVAAAFDFEQLDAPLETERPPRLGEAVERAKAVIARAEAEADAIREAARAVGYDEGFAAGRTDAQLQLQPAAAALGEALSAVRDQQVRAADAVERHAVELAVEIAGKVVAGALEVEPERVLDVISGALRATVERDRVVILVNPDDLELVRSSIDQVAASLGGIEQVEVQQERRVPRGGAVLRTSVGEIDARIQTKLEQSKAAIAAELGG
jgi:flagellar assembly protein FliH